MSFESDLDAIFAEYVAFALWDSVDNEGNELDAAYTVDDISEESLKAMRRDVRDFLVPVKCDGEDEGADELTTAMLKVMTRGQIAHDFWLARNGLGVFCDLNLRELGKRLSDRAKTFGRCKLYVGDDGLVWATGPMTCQ